MKISQRFAALCVMVFAFAFGACQMPPPETANTNASPQPNATPTTANASAERAAPNAVITLPILDYMFQSDESFANDAKRQLGLSDEQVTRLREAARNETAKLGADEGEEYTGTTRAARRLAAEQMSQILGDEKARQFTAFLSTRMSSGGDNASNDTGNIAATNQPNGVPTDTRIVVNAPAFRMDVFDKGQLVKSYRVGIGYPEFPLPVGLRKADTIIFNPTWTPPDEPWVRASSSVKPYQKVEAGSKLNPLGPIKIPIGLPSLIHGGKQPARLGNFASHGCVGLTNDGIQDVSLVLARIAGAELTPEQVKEYQQKKTETENYKLPRTIPVELRYETIVVEDGKLRIFRDVYDRDTNTEQNLRRTLDAHGVSFDSLSEQDRTRILEALKQMSRDVDGSPDSANSNANTNGNANSNSNSNTNSNANTNSNSSRVTRNIKGRKEVSIELSALAGKGYPAPIGMDNAGSESKPAKSRTRKRA